MNFVASWNVRSRRDLALWLGQGTTLATVLLAAIYAPRSGEPMALIPLGTQSMAQALAFAEAEHAALIAIDTTAHRLVVTAPETSGLMRALARGFVPVAARNETCLDPENRSQG